MLIIGHGQPLEVLKKCNFNPIDIIEILAPGVIFAITVDAYLHYITTYKGSIASTSFIFILIALVCCICLAETSGWWLHLRYMFILFASYVCWDRLMLQVMLKRSRYHARWTSEQNKDVRDINLVDSYINIPTLITIFCISILCELLIVKYNVPEATIENFVAGVVSFHLIFSSFAYLYATHRPRRF